MKKRVLCLVLAMITCMSIAIPASATSDPDDGVISDRAVTIPTQMAPASWYDTPHNWTAKYYTYSSYIFTSAGKELWVDVVGPQEFSVEFVSTDGKYDPYVLEAEPWGHGTYKVQADVTGMTFYMVITNLGGGSILSDAYYNVFHPEGHSVRSMDRVRIADVAAR